MGTKTAVLAYADEAVADVLHAVSAGDIDRAAALAARVRPAQGVSARSPGPLANSTDITQSSSVPGLPGTMVPNPAEANRTPATPAAATSSPSPS
jgi:hypothetical protein